MKSLLLGALLAVGCGAPIKQSIGYCHTFNDGETRRACFSTKEECQAVANRNQELKPWEKQSLCERSYE